MTTSWLSEIWNAVLLWLSHHGILFTQTALTWTFAQFAIIIAAFAVALIIAHRLTPAFETYIRRIEGRPRLLRFLAIILRRLRWIFFPLILWFALLVMRHPTWPSRSYLVGLAASLATAWIAISIAPRVIRSRFIARVVAVVAWSIAALIILGLLSDLVTALDASRHRFPGLSPDAAPADQGGHSPCGAGVAGRRRRGGLHRYPSLLGIDDLSPSMQVLTAKLAKAGLIVTAVLMASFVGINLTAFAVFSGVVGLGVGFGLQKVVSNLISGIILLDRQVDQAGRCDLGRRHLRAHQRAGGALCLGDLARRAGVPHPDEDLITSQVVNWSYSSDLVRLDLDFGVAYSADPHEVRRLAREVSAKHKRVQAVPSPSVTSPPSATTPSNTSCASGSAIPTRAR